VIEGREPEAPSVTPDTGPVSRSGTHVPAGRGVPGADGPVAADGQFSGAVPAAEAGPAAGPEQEAGDGPAADLGAIRRSDAIIEMLASRRRPSRRALRDPVVAMLSGLAADVDAAPCRAASRPVTGAGHQPRHARRTGYIGRAGYDRRNGYAHRAGSGRWPDHRAGRPGRMGARHPGSAAAAAAAAIAMAAALAAAAGLVIVAMLTRLTGARAWDRSRGRIRPGRPGRF
jgi:hypothetical protein